MRLYGIISSIILCLVALISCTTGTAPPSDPTLPLLSVSPPSLSFHESETSRTLNIINDGGGELRWEIETEAGWIVCPVAEGETETSMTVEVIVNEKEIGDSDQVCEGTLIIYSNGGNFNVPVYYNPGITVTGFVYGEGVSGTVSLPDAMINIYSSGSIKFTAFTDQDGWYVIENVSKSCDYIEARKDGYYPRAEKLMIPSDKSVEHDFTLQQIPDN